MEAVDAQSAGVGAEARERAIDLLRRLIGVDLQTASGQWNCILGVVDDQAVVATDRSPEGTHVPISSVQDALDRMVETGQVVIRPDQVGYRSAFIGAVLRTLPGVTLEGSPPVAQFGPAHSAILSQSPALTFEGDLETRQQGMGRGEQAVLRRQMFNGATVARCALCGREYPVQFLRAAHIKRRAVCSDAERRDLGNVAMPACLFGCDALFEFGFMSVDATGHVVTSSQTTTAHLHRYLEAVTGKRCMAHDEGTAGYFDWHHSNVWRR